MNKKRSIFSEGTIEALARVLGECGSGTDISRVLEDRGLVDHSGESTKWRRLYHIFLQSQKDMKSPNKILDFTRSFLTPVRFTGRAAVFEEHRANVNNILIMVGLKLDKDGDFKIVDAAKTLDEAEQRVNTIRLKFQNRPMHHEVGKYCNKELMEENYFHAVFEASKGLAQRLRDMSGIYLDGAALVDKIFAIERPILAFNSLQTETEKSEHKGFAQLLKGCFAAVRNPLAHEPKILWSGEDDAADYLTLISLLHRKLDQCIRTGF